MTRDHDDIERVLEHWFSEGPTQMPSRFLDDTLDRIDRAPQGRLARLRTRSFAMHPDRRVVAAAALIVLIAGIGFTVLGRAPAVGVSPSPSPSAESFSDPPFLEGSWMSVGTRHVPYKNGNHIIDTVRRVDIVIGDVEVRWDSTKTDVLSSKSIVGPDTIEFQVIADASPQGPDNSSLEWSCPIGTLGTYRFSATPDDQTLSMTPIADPCAARLAILAGDWQRTEMGDLTPGRHASGILRPFGKAGGQVAYTVPAGWTDNWECSDCLTLLGPGFASLINLSTNVAPSGNLGSCGLPTGQTPTEIAGWLRTLPSLTVSTPTAVSIGGLTGVQVDVSAGADPSTDPCSFLLDGSGNVSLTNPNLPDQPVSVPGKGISRWILLDRGDGSTLLLDLETQDQATWNAVLADGMPVVTSFQFIR